MSKRINQYDSVDFERKILYITGIYCGRKFPNNIAYKLSQLVNSSLSFIFLFLMVAKMIVERDDLELVFDILHTFITEVAFVIKAVYFVSILHKYNALEERLTDPILNQQTPDQDRFISGHILGYKIAGYIFHGLAWTALLLYTVCPVIEGQIWAIPLWVPFGLENYKMFLQVYEVFCLWTLASAGASLDLIPVCLLSIVTAQLDILNENLSNSTYRSPDDTYTVQENKIQTRLQNCVEHHLAIVKCLEDVQEVFSLGVFIQIFTSVVAICMTGLQFLRVTPDSAIFLQILVYFACMLSQIYNTCWIGQKVITKSDYTRDACYMSEWDTCCTSTKKMIFIIMERSKRVLLFRPGNFFNMSLTTFLLIIRNSYSYFAVLVRVYKE